MSEEKQTERRSVVLQPQRMQLAEVWRQDWVANAPPEARIEDIETPEFWALMAVQMKPYSRVEIRADDGTWLVEAIVLGCGRNWARVKILNKYNFSSEEVSQNSDASKYEVKWAGPHDKWRVVRKTDNQVVSKGHENELEARVWVREHERAVG